MNEYRTLLNVVAANPGATAPEIKTIADNRNTTNELLQQAEANEDIVCVSDQYWVVRKGEFAFDEYDHQQPEEPQ